jgi:hypothetical protein
LHSAGNSIAVTGPKRTTIALVRRPLDTLELLTAIQGAAQLAALYRQAQASETLLEIGRALGAERDMVALQQLILRRARELTKADAGSLMLLEDHDGEKKLRFAVAQTGPQDKGTHIGATLPLAASSISGAVALHGEVARIRDAYALGAGGQEQGQRGHLNAREAGEMARRARARHLVLTHYGAKVTAHALREAAATAFAGEITVADDGMDLAL